MSFPIANPVVAVVADAEYDGLFTLTCSGLDNTPNKTLATPIKISNKYLNFTSSIKLIRLFLLA